MRNDKQNPFWTNVDLFSTSYLQHRVYQNKDLQPSKAKPVVEKWRELKQLWDNDALQRILNSPSINESETEDRLINPILKVLGFSALTKTSLAGRNSKSKTFPDYVLFSTDDDVASAMHAEADYKYSNAIGILEAKYFNRDLLNISFDPKRDDRSEKGLPPVQLTTYLKDSDVDWGILTNGAQWQLFFRRGQYCATRYFEFQLADLLSHPEVTDEFALFLYLFSPEAFIKDKTGTSRLDRVHEASRKYTQEVGPSFFLGCEKAIHTVFAEYQRKNRAQSNLAKSKECYQATLIFLFRIIAIRYLEDRGVLPTLSGRYREISLDYIRMDIERKLRSGTPYKGTATLWTKLRVLFKDVNKGTFGVYPGHKGLESDLFEIDFDQFFLENPLNDSLLSECLDLIFRGDGKDRGQIDFYDLGAEKIGDVYNDLLALRLVQADDGKVTLTNSDAKKKELGSYFTHSSLTSILVDGVVDYLGRRHADQSKWLYTKICDNSCGSGHFLRDLVDRLSYELFTSKGNTDPDSTQKIVDQIDFKRMVAQHCIFGVDKDLNAVWLTKLSLWLHTAVAGKPFVFLDHHIKHGDSILARRDSVSEYYSPSDRKKLKSLCDALGRATSNSREDIIENRKVFDGVRAITAKAFKEHCRTVIETIPSPERQFFFNYQCAFPEVFLGTETDGFDVILGNPPWDTVKPKVPDYYKMVTGSTKPPARKEVDQWLAASPSRERDFEKWASRIKEYSKCLKEESGYKLQAGEVYTYAYFTERSLQTLRPGGMLGYVVKLGLYGDEKVKSLREHLFTANKTTKMWLFAKNKFGDIKLFPKIDPNEKFMLFLTEKSKPAAKGEVGAKWVEDFDEINNKFEPWQSYGLPEQLDDIFRVMVFGSARQKAISAKISKSSSSLLEAGLAVVQELHQTNDRKYFSTTEKTIPIYSGAELSSYEVEEANAWLRTDSVLDKYQSARSARIAVNNILPNSRRKLRAAIVPEGVLTANSLLLVTGFTEEVSKSFVLGCLNSMLTEYFLRPRLSNINLNNFRLLGLPLPRSADDRIKAEIEKCAAKLVASRKFSEDNEEYKKIEALLSFAYGLDDAEIREYLTFYPDTKDEFVQDVIDLVKIYRQSFKKRAA